jgi:hypothetical protein
MTAASDRNVGRGFTADGEKKNSPATVKFSFSVAAKNPGTDK